MFWKKKSSQPRSNNRKHSDTSSRLMLFITFKDNHGQPHYLHHEIGPEVVMAVYSDSELSARRLVDRIFRNEVKDVYLAYKNHYPNMSDYRRGVKLYMDESGIEEFYNPLSPQKTPLSYPG